MKILKTLIFIILVSSNFGIVYSQSDIPNQSVNYSYDANGNRVKRWIKVSKIHQSKDSIPRDSIIKNEINNSRNTHQTISLYPNPTQGRLDLNITNMDEGETVEYIFVSLTGQELLRRKSGSPLTQIDISNFAPGTYLVKVSLGTKIETWKIVKQ